MTALSVNERIFEPSLFKDYLKSKVISLLASINSRKLVMIDQAIFPSMNFVAEKKVFVENGVPAENGILAYTPTKLDTNFDQVLIFMAPNAQNLRILRELVGMNQDRKSRKYYVYCCPKRTIICKEFVEIERLVPQVELQDFSFDLLPLDIGLFSLETRCLYDLMIDQNPSIYTVVAESINRLQCVFGKIHNIFGKGRAARAVYEILKIKENEVHIEENYGEIEHLVIIDRTIDMVTPLMRQLTYEGLLDEFFTIQGNVVKIPLALLQDTKEKKAETGMSTFQLNSERDFVYEKVRGHSITGVLSRIRSQSVAYDNFVQTVKSMKNVSEQASAMKRVKTEQEYLNKHVNLHAVLAQKMKTISFHKELLLQQRCLFAQEYETVEYFENFIGFDLPLQKLLRSMCLQSVLDRGIHKKVYSRICEDIVNTYGMQHIVTLTNLANAGLFYEQGLIKESYKFADLKKQLKLVSQAPINHENPTDPSFAYGGYIPISVRLVENAITSGWRNIQKGLQLLPGQTVLPSNLRECKSHTRPAVVVYFVGGVTYGEVAALRLLGDLYNKEIIVATNELINGDQLVKSFIE